MSWLELLADLRGQTIRILALSETFDNGSLSVFFSGGAWMRAHHWRLLSREKPPGIGRLTSWDHREKYGLAEPIDAVAELKQRIEGLQIDVSRFDSESGDLIFELQGGLKLQVLNITGNEVWEISFPDNTIELSNYV